MVNWIWFSNVSSGAPPGTSTSASIRFSLYTSSPPRLFFRVAYHSPGDIDSDEDQLLDWEEDMLGTDPNSEFSDSDEMPDGWEFIHQLDPLVDDAAGDPDLDGLSNSWEYKLGLNPRLGDSDGNGTVDGAEDKDLDTLTNLLELTFHLTDPSQPDSDMDTLGDAWEIAYGMNPMVNNLDDNNPANDPGADPDEDGLTNTEEEQNNTNPNLSDTDDDDVDDQTEVDQGSNPNDPDDKLPPPNGTVSVDVTFGDHSGSHSEKYRVVLEMLEGDCGGNHQRINRAYGQVQTDTFRLPRGSKYRVTLNHVSTDPEYDDKPKPDYDYTLNFNVSQNCVFLDDSQAITGLHNEGNNFFAQGKSCVLYVPLFEWVTPKGSPVTEPHYVDDGQNEFTYSTASPDGVLTIDLKVKVRPSGIAGLTGHDGVKFIDRCAFTLPTINGSTFAWSASSTGGKPAASGDILIAQATYTTLPGNNSDFGLKSGGFTCDGHADTLPNADYEVFFSRDADNHPELGPYPILGRPPNWFYYWSQVIGDNYELAYGGAGDGEVSAEVLGGVEWNYDTLYSKSRIILYDLTKDKFKAYDVGEEFSGIDQFFGSVIHEAKHVDQIARTDAMVPTGQANSPWRFGWSYNQGENHNHWTMGTDGKPGAANVDDDGDGIIDNLITSGPGELGKGDDVDLTHPTATSRNWPAAWPLPSPLIYRLEIEADAINAANIAHDENKRAHDDWGRPGKNHQTIDHED